MTKKREDSCQCRDGLQHRSYYLQWRFSVRGLDFLGDFDCKLLCASGAVDAFSVAYAIPLFAAGGIGFAFSMALISKYHQVLAASGQVAATSLLVSIHASCLVLSVLVMIPLWLVPNEIIQFVAPGLSPGGAQLAGELLRWLSVYVLSLNMVNMLVATFHVGNHFKAPAITEIGFNAVTIIILVCCASSLGIHALVWGIC